MYKTESTLGLIGSILSAVSVAITFVRSLTSVIWMRMPDFTDSWDLPFRSFTGFGTAFIGAGIVAVIFGLLVMSTVTVLGFVGTSMLKSENKRGGVLLVVAGGISLIIPHAGSFPGTAVAVLLLIGGIMALTKKVSTTQQ